LRETAKCLQRNTALVIPPKDSSWVFVLTEKLGVVTEFCPFMMWTGQRGFVRRTVPYLPKVPIVGRHIFDRSKRSNSTSLFNRRSPSIRYLTIKAFPNQGGRFIHPTFSLQK
jgi:hypothetical protein